MSHNTVLAVTFRDMVLFFDQAEAIGLDSPSLDILICSCFKPAETILFVQWSRKLETGHLLKFPVNCPDGELAQFFCNKGCHGSCSPQVPANLYPSISWNRREQQSSAMATINKVRGLSPHDGCPYPFDTYSTEQLVGSSMRRMRVS